MLIRRVMPVLDELRKADQTWSSAVLLSPTGHALLHCGTDAEHAAIVASTIATTWQHLCAIEKGEPSPTTPSQAPTHAPTQDSSRDTELLTMSDGESHHVTVPLTAPDLGVLLLWVRGEEMHLGHVVRQARQAAVLVQDTIAHTPPPEDA